MKLPLDDARAPLFTIGQVSDMLGVQHAFLRRLDQQDIVRPSRSDGRQRRYSRQQIDQVVEVRTLLDEGLTLAGVRRVVELQARVAELEAQLAQLSGEVRAGSGREHRRQPSDPA
ncbi:MerR family transcriptional regulator [Kribbella sp. NPDC048915]|uniref:MerR family transcriptional regulator n=1 Tax=Kribbella sp. NPDC048915 TaxID=3155148 RepID=UPI0033DB080E